MCDGLDGSTEITPTDRSSVRMWRTSVLIKDDLPTPGGPVTPTTNAEPVSGYSSRTSSYERIAVLDERDRPGKRAPITGAHAGRERVERQG